jgi:hypothetical protein
LKSLCVVGKPKQLEQIVSDRVADVVMSSM